jgi:hypothetical protein
MAKPNEADLHVHSPLQSNAIIALSSDVILRRHEFGTNRIDDFHVCPTFSASMRELSESARVVEAGAVMSSSFAVGDRLDIRTGGEAHH